MCVCGTQCVGGGRGEEGGGERREEEREEWKSVKQEAYRFQVAVNNSLSV